MSKKLSDRLEQVVNLKISGNWAELARRSKLRPSTLQQVKEGKDARGSTLLRISNALDISIGWLMTGEGEMFRPPARPPPTLEVIAKNLVELTEEQRQEILARTGEMLLLNSVRKEVEQLRELIAQKLDKE